MIDKLLNILISSLKTLLPVYIVKQKTIPSLITFIFMACAPWLNASPLISLGPNSGLFFNGSVALEYQSNIFLDDPELSGSSGEDEFAYIFSPGVELNFGDGTADNNVVIIVREDFKTYNEKSALDTENLFFLLSLTYTRAPVNIEASANFFELVQNTADVNRLGALTESEMTLVNFRGEYEFSAKTSVEGKFGYFRTHYITAGPIDNTVLEFPVNIYYAYSSKLDVSFGFRYRHTDIPNRPSNEDTFVNIGLRGELTPKLDATIQIGVIHRELGNIALKDDTSPGINSTFTWFPTELTTVDASIKFDYSTGGTAATLKNTGATVAVLHSFTPLIIGNAVLSYNNAEYRDGLGRVDDSYNAALSIIYSPNDYMTFMASYSYMKNESNTIGGNFDNSALRITASLRY